MTCGRVAGVSLGRQRAATIVGALVGAVVAADEVRSGRRTLAAIGCARRLARGLVAHEACRQRPAEVAVVGAGAAAVGAVGVADLAGSAAAAVGEALGGAARGVAGLAGAEAAYDAAVAWAEALLVDAHEG